MKDGVTKSSWVGAFLLLFDMAFAQGVQVELVLEKTFSSYTEDVAIDYDRRGRPMFTIVSEDQVEVMDSRGYSTTIVYGLTRYDDLACPSENGRFVGVSHETAAWDIVHKLWYMKHDFTLKRRSGATVWRCWDCPFNEYWVANNGAICARWVLGIGWEMNWRYFDSTGQMTREFPKDAQVTFFGDHGSYLLSGGDSLGAYGGDHGPLWSTDSFPPADWRTTTTSVSSDGRYFVRYHCRGAEFYRDGELLHTDTTIGWSWEPPSEPEVIMTPDNGYVLLIPGTGYQAHLWNLEENRLVRTYERPDSRQLLADAACSSEGERVVFHTYTRRISGSIREYITLYNRQAEVVWQTDAPAEETTVEPLSRLRWFTIDPSGTWVCQRSSTKLWLYRVHRPADN